MITTENDKQIGNGNGTATVFSFSPIALFETGELTVTKVSTTGVETVLVEGSGDSNYTVTLSAPNQLPSTGSVTYPSAGATRLQTGEQLVMKRELALLQDLDLVNQGGYFPDVQEEGFDKAVMRDIQLQEQIDRSIKVPVSSTISSVLPLPDAGKVLGWNATEDALENITLAFATDNTSLVVVSDAQPPVVSGRIWITESNPRVIRICDGTNYEKFATVREDGTSVDIEKTLIVTGDNSSFVSSTAVAPLRLQQQFATASSATLGLVKDRGNGVASSANDGIYDITFGGNDGSGNSQTFNRIINKLLTATHGNERSSFVINTTQAGATVDEVGVAGGVIIANPSGTYKGTGSLNIQDRYYTNNILNPLVTTSIQSGTTHSPVLADHGKTFIYTNAAACTITLPTISSVFEGYTIHTINGHGGVNESTLPSGVLLIVNRSSSDTIDPALTQVKVPARNGYNRQTWQVLNGKWYTLQPRWYINHFTYLAGGSLTTASANVNGALDPGQYRADLYCSTADTGYEVTDVVQCPTVPLQSNAAAGFGMLVKYDPTAVTMNFDIGSNGIFIPNETTGVQAVITDNNWIVRVYGYY